VTGPRDLTGAEVRRVALAGPNVPAGIYARQALQKLRLWDALEKGRRVVSGENVRVTLAYVERGEVEAGIVYSTDARITKQVEQVHAFDPSTHDPIRYPLVLLQRGAGHAGARKFYDYLRSPGAGEVFRKYGFSVLEQK
jgi:molybdate transport system substrate-binding protein